VPLKARPTSAGIKTRIEQAFKRSAEIDANRIAADITDGTVTLRGTVRTWAEKQEAERVAWASPGVARVQNLLLIGN
jgi:osmotically-inducible protein OsmY